MPKPKTETPDKPNVVWVFSFHGALSFNNPRGGARRSADQNGWHEDDIKWDVFGGIEVIECGETMRIPYSQIRQAVRHEHKP